MEPLYLVRDKEILSKNLEHYQQKLIELSKKSQKTFFLTEGKINIRSFGNYKKVKRIIKKIEDKLKEYQ